MIEREILGCFLQDNSLVLETTLRPTFFLKQEHQLLFQSMIKLAHEGKAIDKISLLQENYDYIGQLGGPDFITRLESEGNIKNFETYEKQLIDDYKKRQSINLAKRYTTGQESLEELLEKLQELNELGFTEERSTREIIEEMFILPDIEQTENGIKSGLNDLDKYLGAFKGSNSYIVGARPSMGKTALMLKFALEAIKQGAYPVMFSLEMNKESLIKRLIATIGNINLFLTNSPYELTNSKKVAWKQAVERLANYEFEIYDQPAQTTEFIRAKTRQAKANHENIIVLIDYLTLIHTTKHYQSEHLRVGAISKELKNIAKAYDCPVVTLAQLSRVVEQRQDKRPMLSDLRESGSIEEDADCIMFLYREGYYNKERDNNELEIIVAKNRNGPTGAAKIYYNKSTGRMGNLDYQRTV